MDYIKIISEIKKEREDSGVFPTFALFSWIVQRAKKPRDEVKKELNKLVADKKIHFGRTINDFYFYICE